MRHRSRGNPSSNIHKNDPQYGSSALCRAPHQSSDPAPEISAQKAEAARPPEIIQALAPRLNATAQQKAVEAALH